MLSVGIIVQDIILFSVRYEGSTDKGYHHHQSLELCLALSTTVVLLTADVEGG